MKNIRSKNNAILSVVQFCYLASFSIYFSFIIIYMRSYGYSAFYCGLSQMITAIVMLIVGPAVAHIIDRKIGSKRFLVVGLLMAAFTSILVPLTISYSIIGMIAVVIQSVFVRQFVAPIDAFTLICQKEDEKISYGLSRGIGSLGEGLGALLIGYMVAWFGYGAMFISHGALLIIAAIASTMLPPIELKEDVEKRPSMGTNLKDLLNNRLYRSLLISVIFLNIGVKIISIYSGILIEELGGGSESLGIIVFLCGVMELVVFILISYLEEDIHPKYLYLLAIITFAVGGYYSSSASTIRQFALGRVLTSMTYAMYLSIIVAYVKRILPFKSYTIGLSVITVSSGSIAHIISAFLGGLIIDNLAMEALLVVIVITVVLSLISFLPHFITRIAR
ncbi:MAG: MFS transporter [Epulopiscium sp.]|nr:MFS transporter [Candidatus Epulonipiscium sp.]